MVQIRETKLLAPLLIFQVIGSELRGADPRYNNNDLGESRLGIVTLYIGRERFFYKFSVME